MAVVGSVGAAGSAVPSVPFGVSVSAAVVVTAGVSSGTVAGATTSLASVSFGEPFPALLALRYRPTTKFAGDVLGLGELGSASSESDLTSSAFFSFLNAKKLDKRLSLGLVAGLGGSAALTPSAGVAVSVIASVVVVVVVVVVVGTGTGSVAVSAGLTSSGLASGSYELTS